MFERKGLLDSALCLGFERFVSSTSAVLEPALLSCQLGIQMPEKLGWRRSVLFHQKKKSQVQLQVAKSV